MKCTIKLKELNILGLFLTIQFRIFCQFVYFPKLKNSICGLHFRSRCRSLAVTKKNFRQKLKALAHTNLYSVPTAIPNSPRPSVPVER